MAEFGYSSPQRRSQNRRTSFQRESSSSFGNSNNNRFPSSRGVSRSSPDRQNSFSSDPSDTTLSEQGRLAVRDCSEGNGFIRDDSCTSYIRCRNGSAIAEECPDGLYFAPNRAYPCAYPQEGTCLERTGGMDFTAPGAPGECTRAYQLFRSPNFENDCATYTSCVENRGYVFNCLPGQAYDPVQMICDYADKVPSCNVEEYVGLSCEQVPFEENEVGLYTKQQIPGECRQFYICLNRADGRVVPRLSSCPEFTAFDPETTLCSDTPEQVTGCENLYPLEVLQSIRQRNEEQSQRREQRLLEIAEKLNG